MADPRPRAHLTPEEVYEALEKLSAARLPVTIDGVRQALGDRGSYTTISRLIRRWRSGAPARPPEALAPQASPDPVPEPLHGPMQALWERAQREAEAHYQERVESLQEAREVLDARHAQDQADLAAAQARLSEQQEAHADLLERVNGLARAWGEAQGASQRTHALVEAQSQAIEVVGQGQATLQEQSTALVSELRESTRGVTGALDELSKGQQAAAEALTRLLQRLAGNEAAVLQEIEGTRHALRGVSAQVHALERAREVDQQAVAEFQHQQAQAREQAQQALVALGAWAQTFSQRQERAETWASAWDARLSALESAVATQMAREEQRQAMRRQRQAERMLARERSEQGPEGKPDSGPGE